MNKITPIFIFSLPRSGSTLLQRLLINHSKISSTSEPWILLPLLNLDNLSFNGNSLYNDNFSSRAVNEFFEKLPNKKKSYYKYLNSLISSLYFDLSDSNSNYFIDKTPRYYYIINQINIIFPDAKFIFLTRHPLGIINSVMKTWFYGSFPKTMDHYSDINQGFHLLYEGFETFKEKSIHVSYENLVSNSSFELKRIFDYLNIEELNSDSIYLGSNQLSGGFGDKTGKKKYNNIDSKSIDDWNSKFNSIFGKIVFFKIYKKFSLSELEFHNFKIPTFTFHWYNIGMFILLDYYISYFLSKTKIWYGLMNCKKYFKSKFK